MPAARAPAADPSVLRVVIGEDDVLMREGMASLLSDAGLDVVAQADNALDLVRKVLAHRPHVAIVDVRMPPDLQADGLVAAIELRRQLPQTGVLVLSNYYDASYALQLIGDRPDGVGYLLKERIGDVSAFVDAIGRIAAGGTALDPEVVTRMLGRRHGDDPLGRLTARELEVLAAMAEGKSNIGVADTLYVTEAAVEKHVTSIFRKLELGGEASGHRRVRAVLAFVSDRMRRP
jgi:DNA-binding NarL/FixJ family response regulator